MNSDDFGIRRLELPVSAANRIFAERILPRVGVRGDPVDHPTMVMVGGQQGSGKTTLINNLHKRFAGQAVQRIVGDDLMAFVPGYRAAARIDSKQAQIDVGHTPGYWADLLMDHAVKQRAHIVLELAFPTAIEQAALDGKFSGYRTELHVIATNRRESWTAAVSRFERALSMGDADARIVSHLAHNIAYRRWPVGVERAEYGEDRAIDRIEILRRDGSVLFANERDPASRHQQKWANPPRAMEVLFLERNRAVTEQEATAIEKTWDRLLKSPVLSGRADIDVARLARDRDEIVAFHRSAGSRFDLFRPNASNTPRAATEWVNHFVTDMHRTLEAINSPWSREEQPTLRFDRRFDNFMRTVKNGVERNLVETRAMTAERHQPAQPKPETGPQQERGSSRSAPGRGR